MISHDGGLSFGVVLEKGQEGPRIANVPLLFVIEYVCNIWVYIQVLYWKKYTTCASSDSYSITIINLATAKTLEFLAPKLTHNYTKKHVFFSIQTSTIPYHLPIYHSSDQVHEFLRCNTVGVKLKYNATKYVTVSSMWFPLSKTISKKLLIFWISFSFFLILIRCALRSRS